MNKSGDRFIVVKNSKIKHDILKGDIVEIQVEKYSMNSDINYTVFDNINTGNWFIMTDKEINKYLCKA